MVTRNEKSMMKLVRQSIVRPLLEILGKFKSLDNLKNLYGLVARLAFSGES